MAQEEELRVLRNTVRGGEMVKSVPGLWLLPTRSNLTRSLVPYDLVARLGECHADETRWWWSNCWGACCGRMAGCWRVKTML